MIASTASPHHSQAEDSSSVTESLVVVAESVGDWVGDWVGDAVGVAGSLVGGALDGGGLVCSGVSDASGGSASVGVAERLGVGVGVWVGVWVGVCVGVSAGLSAGLSVGAGDRDTSSERVGVGNDAEIDPVGAGTSIEPSSLHALSPTRTSSASARISSGPTLRAESGSCLTPR